MIAISAAFKIYAIGFIISFMIACLIKGLHWTIGKFSSDSPSE